MPFHISFIIVLNIPSSGMQKRLALASGFWIQPLNSIFRFLSHTHIQSRRCLDFNMVMIRNGAHSRGAEGLRGLFTSAELGEVPCQDRHRADLSEGDNIVLYLNLILTQNTKAAAETKNRDKVCPPTSSGQTLWANPFLPPPPSVPF